MIGIKMRKPMIAVIGTGDCQEDSEPYRQAMVVGRLIAERATKAGIEQVAFDRSGFKYHGRVKALADAAREHGLKF